MSIQQLRVSRYLLTFALLLNTIAWFIPDMFFPDSHFRSSVWPLHARLHVGAAATLNMVYIMVGLFMIWRPTDHLRQTMRWIAGGLATWNIVFMLFGLTVLPFIMGPDDTYISWSTDPSGAGNEHGTGLEGFVFLMAGIPALLFLLVLWQLKSEGFNKTKKILGVLLLLAMSSPAFTQLVPGSFVTTWQTDIHGQTADNQLLVPGIGTYDIYWEKVNDNSINGTATATGTHLLTLPSAGTYRVGLSGDLDRIYFNGRGDAEKLLTIEDWGAINWTSMHRAFKGCLNLQISATLPPDLSQVTTLNSLFFDCTSLNADLNNWDVSNVTFLDSTFFRARDFNGNINDWDVGNVTRMVMTFFACESFNQNIGAWDVSEVRLFVGTFYDAHIFNQNLNNWDTGNALNISGMFFFASSFNQPLGNWNTSKVETLRFTFRNASDFNQDISGWDTGEVEEMEGVFWNAENFNQDLGSWNISKVTTMEGLFNNSGLGLSNYDATLVGWESGVHPNNIVLDANGLKFCTGQNAHALLRNNDGWTISGDTEDCTDAFVTLWQTTEPGTSANNQFIFPATGNYSYYTKLVNDPTPRVFGSANGTKTFTFPEGGRYRLTVTGDLSNIRFNNTNDRSKLIAVERWGKVVWRTMENAFYGCNNLQITAQDVPDLSRVTNAEAMFKECTSMNALIGGWDVSNLRNVSSMFEGATSFNRYIGNWATENFMNMSSMFANTISFNQYIGDWDVRKVTSLSFTFGNAVGFNTALNGWETESLQNLRSTFFGATAFNKDLSNWQTDLVTNMDRTFFNANSFDQSLEEWDISQVSSMSSLLDNTALSIDNYDATLIAWSTGTQMANVDFGAAGLEYCLSADERTFLTDTRNWDISGDAFVECAGLPVTWLSFTASAKEKSVLLRWTTTAEENHDYFLVQRSPDGITWENLGQIYEQEATTQGHFENDYTFDDLMPILGDNFYRILQFDLDGSTNSSVMQRVKFKNSTDFSAYPNPASFEITAVVPSGYLPTHIRIFDAAGRQFLLGSNTRVSDGRITIDVHHLPVGIYLLDFGDHQERFIKK